MAETVSPIDLVQLNQSFVNALEELKEPTLSSLAKTLDDLRLACLIENELTKILNFLVLQKNVRKTASDVKQYLSLGWIEVCDFLSEQDSGLDNVMEIWDKFHSFLLRLLHLILNLEQFLSLWERMLYLLLFMLSFSEFPDKRRPICTTMPWTIWPALVVLWGVCWMFYDEHNWIWEDQVELPAAENAIMSFEGSEYSDPSQAFSFNPSDIANNISTRFTPDSGLPNLEPQLPLGLPEFSNTAIYSDHASASSAVNATVGIDPLVTYHSTADRTVAPPSSSTYPAASTMEIAIEDQLPAATNWRDLEPLNTSSVYVHPRDGQVGSSGGSRHGQTEKYLCPHRDCIRSQQGLGFKRKDHLNQHLRGPHKQASVPRLRATPAAASSAGNRAATNNITGAVSQSKKRKRTNAEETGSLDVDQLEKELAEERRLRALAEQRNRRLQEQLDYLQRRMEKHEHLDKMLTLWEEHKARESPKE